MKTTKFSLFLKLCSFLCVIVLLLAFLYAHGYRVNLSGSLPQWIFKIREDQEDISRGDYVVVDYSLVPDNPVIQTGIERGYLSRFPMLKQVGAVSGDLISLRDSRLYVNGADMGYMVVLSADSRGDPLSAYPTPLTLRGGQYWLISNPERGFDSRYFGQIDRSCITHTAAPVF